MTLVEVSLMTRELAPGWPLTKDDVPLGRRYIVDLDQVSQHTIINLETGACMPCRCIWVVSPEPSGWLPAIAFGLADNDMEDPL